MTDESKNLIIESFGEVWNANFPGGRILHIPSNASNEQVKAAIAYYEHKYDREKGESENPEKIYLEVLFSETQQ